ncbi:GT4 family glycosyltransferase PelF [Vibrio penaeicida]|uniref:Pellicle/biofilm biosynthesis glycosyltransferase PelF n=1 Tax=Vibrio penaeicida TaxID=104609 RepID=A0AAV5NXF5_9VIBR|nr:GT4 family glycosyltransferase PelF [Vibrio penaeicida]RTZ22392.1 DUF3492 domain-containing protein [Vibrio penaeicida]GLQ75381.1 pellicle/biofilm biosynthesis glycosyltransferase PelF [Vibrio penaeicida]
MKKDVDVCLLLEGTYPYVRGGVSSWVHQIISGLPDFTFHLIFIGGHPDFYDEAKYTFPDNVVGFEVHYLLNEHPNTGNAHTKSDKEAFLIWKTLLDSFENPDTPISGDLLKQFALAVGNRKLCLNDFLHSKNSWQILTEKYINNAPTESFVDFFWTFRNIYQPLFILAGISQSLPPAKIYHSISTGYAGFLGSLCHQVTGRPLVISEHGIYTKERKIDLSQASWIKDRHSVIDISMHREMEAVRKTWIQFFEQLGLTAYHQASQVISLFEGNRKRQHQDGAPETKTKVIVNGINLSRFEQAYQQRPNTPPHVIGLIGRVVPIKDIKTFIRTIRIAAESVPDIEGWIIGPSEEDENYLKECQLLIESLGLCDKVSLLGNQDVTEMMPKLGALILTSISEAQPLVLLEAMASGIPCISTEVGACREIIEGADNSDDAFGSAGAVIPMASPTEGAKAIVELLKEPKVWQKKGDNGRQRVCKYYQDKDMFEAYQNLYKESIQWQE